MSNEQTPECSNLKLISTKWENEQNNFAKQNKMKDERKVDNELNDLNELPDERLILSVQSSCSN